jgi:protein MpaA
MDGIWRECVVAMLVFAAGCVSREKSMSPPPSSSQAADESPVEVPGARKVMLGISVKGTPLEAQVIGSSSGRPVLILAAIHGNEPTTANLSRGILKLLAEHPDLAEGQTVAVLAVANPDGLEARTRTNANKVDINRNFPAINWKTSLRKTSYYNGPSPASEPETRALMKAVETLRPVRILTIHSITDGRSCNNYDGPGEALAEAMSRHNHYPPAATIGYPTPGSFGSWAGIDLQIPTITLELPRTTRGEQAWEENREAMLEFIRFSTGK